MKNLTNPDYWNKEWKNFKHTSKKILFKDIFDKYLPKNDNLSCIEIGCAPGRFLVYLNKKFGYNINGIDFADITPMKKLFEKNGIKNYNLYKKDFLKFQIKKKFDVVCSFGFIEHFNNYELIFKRHTDLLKKNGVLILEMPNFNNLQYYLHKLLDKKNLERHNINIMDLKILKQLAKENNLEINYLGYYKTAGFWIDNNDKHNIFTKIIAFSIKVIFKIISTIINRPNKHLSPFIILIAKKEK